MKKLGILFSLLVVFTCGAAAQGLAVGGTMENFSLADTSGKMQMLNEIKGTKGALIVFVSAQCPVVAMYNERMNQIATDYKAKGINVIGINSNVTETGEQIKSHAAVKFNFPVLIDKDSVLADKLGATRTPEVYFVDAKNVLLYTGAIDDDRSAKNITAPYLRTAFELWLAGKKIEKTLTTAFGCTIKRATD